MQDYVRHAISDILRQVVPKFVIVGGALGVDTWAAEEAFKLNIPYHLAIPFEGQESKWPRESQERYRKMRASAAQVIIVESGGYAPYKMQLRNKWMVDRCDILVAVWNGSSGGTANCYQYAKSKKVKIIRITPPMRP